MIDFNKTTGFPDTQGDWYTYLYIYHQNEPNLWGGICFLTNLPDSRLPLFTESLDPPMEGRMNLYSKRCFGVLKLAIFEGSQPGFWILVVLISQSKATKLWLVGLEIWTILKTSRLCLLGWTSRVIQLTSWGWQVIALFTSFYTSQVVRISSINSIKTSWWFEKSQSNWIISPTFWGENEHIFDKTSTYRYLILIMP